MIKWNEYTWYSKLAAIIVLIILIPLLAFYIGRQYEQTSDVLMENGASEEGGTTSSGSQTTTTNTSVTQTGNSNPPVQGSVFPKPVILTLNPSRGPAGANVIINGLNFDTKNDLNTITFSKDGKVYKTEAVRSSSGETLNFSIPGSVSTANPGVSSVELPAGTYSITVRTRGGVSAPVTFTVTSDQ